MATSAFNPKPLPKSDPTTGAGGTNSSTEKSTPKPSTSSPSPFVKPNPNQSTQPPSSTSRGNGGGSSSRGGGGSSPTQSPSPTPPPSPSPIISTQSNKPILSSQGVTTREVKEATTDAEGNRIYRTVLNYYDSRGRLQASEREGNITRKVSGSYVGSKINNSSKFNDMSQISSQQQSGSSGRKNQLERTEVSPLASFQDLAQSMPQQKVVPQNVMQSYDPNRTTQVFGGNTLEPIFSLATPVRQVIRSGTQETIMERNFGTFGEAQASQLVATPSQRQARADLSIQGQQIALQRQMENAQLIQEANTNRGFIRSTTKGLFVEATQRPVDLLQASQTLSPNIRSNIERGFLSLRRLQGYDDSKITGVNQSYSDALKTSFSSSFGLLNAPTQQLSFLSLNPEERRFAQKNSNIMTQGFESRDQRTSFIGNFALGFPLVEPIVQESLSLSSKPKFNFIKNTDASFISGAIDSQTTQADKILATRIATRQKGSTVFGQGVADFTISGIVERIGKVAIVTRGVFKYASPTISKLSRAVSLDIAKQIAFKAAPIEGFINVQSQAGGRGQTASYTDIALGVGTSVPSAFSASYAQNYPKITGNKVLSRVVNFFTYGTDPSEYIGDVGEQIVSNAQIRGGTRLQIPEIRINKAQNGARLSSVTRQPENPFDFYSGSKSSVKTVTLDVQQNTFNSGSARNKQLGYSTSIRTLSSIPTQTQTSGLDTTTQTISKSSSQSQIQSNPVSNPRTSIRSQSLISIPTEIPTQIPTQIPTRIPTRIGVKIIPSVSSLINFPAFVPIDPIGSGGRRRQPRGKGKSYKGIYTRDITSIIFGDVIKAQKLPKIRRNSLGVLSGLGVRY